MTTPFTPDPSRLASARAAVQGYVERKRRWTRAMFVVAAVAEITLFGAMLLFFDFTDRLYWFVFVGMLFVYSPLITFILRNSIMLDRAYWRLRVELATDPDLSEGRSIEGDEARSFLRKRNRWVRWLFVLASVFELGLFVTLLFVMDFSSRLDWFLFFGFLAVYTPLIVSTWRNTFAIDRLYYGVIETLKYEVAAPVEGGSAGDARASRR